jgi:hypothetical protein
MANASARIELSLAELRAVASYAVIAFGGEDATI